jgi:hypothetical protein
MSKTAAEIGMIAGGIALIALSYYDPELSITLFQNFQISAGMLAGMGVAVAGTGAAGLLSGIPNDPSNIGPQGQLPVQSPNPLWRVVYGIFSFAGAISFSDGPVLDWVGTGGPGQTCENQYMHEVHTLTCHQIAGFLAVVIDGQTFNFGTDLVLLTTANNHDEYGYIGNPGLWGFTNPGNAWRQQIYFEFDAGDPGNAGQPFPFLVSGATMIGQDPPTHSIVIGSTRWPATALQRGRAKVHVLVHFQPGNATTGGPPNGAPQPYPLGSGRIPTVEFTIAGRIILDYRVATAWQGETTYPQNSYVLALANGSLPGGVLTVFVQQNSNGVSAPLTPPNFAGVAAGATVSDGTCLWKNCLFPMYAAGSGQTLLNNPTSSKLGGPGGSILIADAWQGGLGYLANTVIEAPLGWLQMATTVGVSGSNRPNFATKQGVPTPDNTMAWVCLGRSIYATCLPDADGTTNQGGLSNPALCIADYLQTPKNEFGLGATLTYDSIDTVIAAASICDTPTVIEVF